MALCGKTHPPLSDSLSTFAAVLTGPRVDARLALGLLLPALTHPCRVVPREDVPPHAAPPLSLFCLLLSWVFSKLHLNGGSRNMPFNPVYEKCVDPTLVKGIVHKAPSGSPEAQYPQGYRQLLQTYCQIRPLSSVRRPVSRVLGLVITG